MYKKTINCFSILFNKTRSIHQIQHTENAQFELDQTIQNDALETLNCITVKSEQLHSKLRVFNFPVTSF